jgi:hypothetical protein
MASPDKKAFLLRIDPAVWAQIERLAAAELRSVNGEIEYLLRQALAQRGRTKAQSASGGRAPPPAGPPDPQDPGNQ